MAQLSVKDYGAAGNGSSDDTDAINSALDDSGPEDTVYFPAGTYMVRQTGSREAVGLHRAGDGATVRGETDGTTPQAAIKMMDVPTGDEPNKWVLGVDGSDSSPMAVTVRDLIVQGNRDENRDIPGYNVKGFNFYEKGAGYDIRFEDCIFEDIPGNAFTVNESNRVTVERCTIRHTDRHGYTGNGIGDGGPDNPELVLRDIHMEDIGYDGHGCALDIGEGHTLIENIYVASAEQGCKIGETAGSPDSFTLRRANLRNSIVNSGWRYTGPDGGLNGADVHFDRVQFMTSHLDGIRFEDNARYTGTEVLVDSPNQSERGGRVGVTTMGGCDVDIDTLRIQNNPASEALDQGSSGSFNVTNLYHANNAGGAGDTDGCENVINSESAELDVPGPNDVGIYGAGSDPGTPDPGDGGGTDPVETKLLTVHIDSTTTNFYFTVSGGTVSKGPNAEDNDTITTSTDGHNVQGRTGNNHADDFNIEVGATLSDWSIDDPNASVTMDIDGREIAPSDFPVTVGQTDGGGGSGGGDDGTGGTESNVGLLLGVGLAGAILREMRKNS